jgi:predicted transcriptional regulator
MNDVKDEASFVDTQYRLYLLEEIRRGSEEIDRGEAVDHEEVKRRLEKWLGE